MVRDHCVLRSGAGPKCGRAVTLRPPCNESLKLTEPRIAPTRQHCSAPAATQLNSSVIPRAKEGFAVQRSLSCSFLLP